MKSQKIKQKTIQTFYRGGDYAFFRDGGDIVVFRAKRHVQSVSLKQDQTVVDGRCVSDLISGLESLLCMADTHEIIDQI